MKQIYDELMALLNEFELYIHIFLIAALVVVGLTFLLSEEGTEKLKKRAPFMLIGYIIAAGAVVLGSNYGASLKF